MMCAACGELVETNVNNLCPDCQDLLDVEQELLQDEHRDIPPPPVARRYDWQKWKID